MHFHTLWWCVHFWSNWVFWVKSILFLYHYKLICLHNYSIALVHLEVMLYIRCNLRINMHWFIIDSWEESIDSELYDYIQEDIKSNKNMFKWNRQQTFFQKITIIWQQTTIRCKSLQEMTRIDFFIYRIFGNTFNHVLGNAFFFASVAWVHLQLQLMIPIIVCTLQIHKSLIRL